MGNWRPGTNRKEKSCAVAVKAATSAPGNSSGRAGRPARLPPRPRVPWRREPVAKGFRGKGRRALDNRRPPSQPVLLAREQQTRDSEIAARSGAHTHTPRRDAVLEEQATKEHGAVSTAVTPAGQLCMPLRGEGLSRSGCRAAPGKAGGTVGKRAADRAGPSARPARGSGPGVPDRRPCSPPRAALAVGLRAGPEPGYRDLEPDEGRAGRPDLPGPAAVSLRTPPDKTAAAPAPVTEGGLHPLGL